MVEELFDLGNLSRWEDSFLVSVSDKLDRDIPLSEREEEKVREIYREKV